MWKASMFVCTAAHKHSRIDVFDSFFFSSKDSQFTINFFNPLLNYSSSKLRSKQPCPVILHKASYHRFTNIVNSSKWSDSPTSALSVKIFINFGWRLDTFKVTQEESFFNTKTTLSPQSLKTKKPQKQQQTTRLVHSRMLATTVSNCAEKTRS